MTYHDKIFAALFTPDGHLIAGNLERYRPIFRRTARSIEVELI